MVETAIPSYAIISFALPSARHSISDRLDLPNLAAWTA
jgi:hypothetical protein